MKAQKGFTLAEIVIALFTMAMFWIAPACTHYVVNFWLAYMHKPENFGWGWSILGLFLGPVPVIAAVMTKIASFFLL